MKGFVFKIIIGFIVGLILQSFGFFVGKDIIRREAISKGYMVRVVDVQTESVQFKWKDEITSNSVILGGKIEK